MRILFYSKGVEYNDASLLLGTGVGGFKSLYVFIRASAWGFLHKKTEIKRVINRQDKMRIFSKDSDICRMDGVSYTK